MPVKMTLLMLFCTFSAGVSAQESSFRYDPGSSGERIYYEWNLQWSQKPEIRSWFQDWRSESANTTLSDEDLKQWYSEHLLNLPGYTRTPTNSDVFRLQQIMKDDSLTPDEAWKYMGTYFMNQADSDLRPLWTPAYLDTSSTPKSTPDLLPGTSTDLDALIKVIEAQTNQIRTLTMSLIDLRSRVETLEAN